MRMKNRICLGVALGLVMMSFAGCKKVETSKETESSEETTTEVKPVKAVAHHKKLLRVIDKDADGNVLSETSYEDIPDDETVEHDGKTFTRTYTLTKDDYDEIEYDDQGHEISRYSYSDGQLLNYEISEYRADGTMKTQYDYEEDGTLSVVSNYDERGFKVSSDAYQADGSVRTNTVYENDEAGNELCSTIYDHGEVCMSDESTYDERGHVLTWTLRLPKDKGGDYYSKCEYSYGKDTYQVKHYTKDDGDSDFRFVYEEIKDYDEDTLVSTDYEDGKVTGSTYWEYKQ